MFYLFFLVFCFLKLSSIDCYVFDEQLFLDNLKSNQAIEQLYYPYLNKTLNLIDLLIDDLSTNQLNNQCAVNLNQIKNGLIRKDKWALLYYESIGFPKNGRLNGDYNNLGHYDQCLSVPETEMDSSSSFDTKFCLISIHTPEWNQLVRRSSFNNYFDHLEDSTKEMFKFNLGKILGVCLPSSCDTHTVLQIINRRILMPVGLNANSQRYCSTKTSKSSKPFAFTEIISLSILGTAFALCILSTFFKQNEFLSHFSISKNLSRVYDYNPFDTKLRSTDYLHGLKVVLVSFSILLHCFGIVIFQTPFLFSKVRYFNAGIFQGFLDRVFLFADQLFFYGGFFAMFSWYDSIKKINVTPYRYIFTRLIRIFVVSIMIILIVFLLPLISNGPYYQDLTEKCSINCAKNFWKNLLFINNLSNNYQEICWIPTWYYSADMQLYLLNYFLIHLLVKNPKAGLKLAAFELVVGSTVVICYDYFKNIPYYYNLISGVDSISLFKLEEHYLPTIYHSNTFVIGILCAWAIKSGLKFKFLEKKINRTLVSTFAIASIITAMTLPDIWEKGIVKKNDLLIIIWSVVDKFLVCFAVGWGFYAVSCNYYVSLKKFFSLRCWIPISQISFSIVMCQFLYFYYTAGKLETLYSFDLSFLLKEFLYAYTVTFLISNLTFVVFETPVTSIMLKLFNLNRRRDIKVDKQTEVKYDYVEINNNNPDFKPITKKVN